MPLSTSTDGTVVFHALATPGLDVERPVAVRFSGSSEGLRRALEGLPAGAARPEAAAARLARDGGMRWGDPESPVDRRELVRLSWERGASSIEIVRADRTLLPVLQVGGFFSGSWRRRFLRRVLCRVVPRPLLHRLTTALAADVAFWRGVRASATRREWERLTRSSYVVLNYHRLAGERKPGQERLDVSPQRFERHMRWLRKLGMRPLAADELIAFHSDADVTLPRRTFVLSADDGFRDAAVALARHTDLRPYLFIPTSAVGGTATWIDGEPVVSWSDVAELSSRGAAIGSHSRTHCSLPDLDDATLREELEQSLHDLRARLGAASAMLAYPHGRNDERVRRVAAEVGYSVAFSTEPGRNGAGSDPYRLRRVEPKEWDGPVVVAWKALTGELFPWSLERWKFRLFLLRRGA